MKQLNLYIIEKLHLNKDTDIKDINDFIPAIKDVLSKIKNNRDSFNTYDLEINDDEQISLRLKLKVYSRFELIFIRDKVEEEFKKNNLHYYRGALTRDGDNATIMWFPEKNITEKLHLNKELDAHEYKYEPKDEGELIRIIVDKINEIRSKDKSIRTFDLNDIDTSQITDMTKLFWGIRRIVEVDNVDISKWDVSNVQSFNNCFVDLQQFNCDISKWDVSSCHDFESMFDGCYYFNQDLSQWNFSKGENFKFMFNSCHNFDTDVSSWDLSNANSITRMFDNCHKFKGIGIDKMKINSKIIKDKHKRVDTFNGCDLIKNFPDWYEES